jgi:DNA mismatch endonuclease (patch repair protein)
MLLRRELHRRGRRYRVDRSPVEGLRTKADVLFGPLRVAVYVDGCFWHRCPIHGTDPKSNSDWWEQKLSRNVARDRRIDENLSEAGWTVVRVWEHEDPFDAADRIESVLDAQSGSLEYSRLLRRHFDEIPLPRRDQSGT